MISGRVDDHRVDSPAGGDERASLELVVGTELPKSPLAPDPTGIPAEHAKHSGRSLGYPAWLPALALTPTAVGVALALTAHCAKNVK